MNAIMRDWLKYISFCPLKHKDPGLLWSFDCLSGGNPGPAGFGCIVRELYSGELCY